MEHDPGAMLRRQEALDRGYSDDEIRRLYTRGEWQRIGRGAYLSASMYSALGEEERHRFLIESTVHAVSDDAVLSHQSAAVVYGLPLWKMPLDRVHVTRNRRGGGRIKRRTTVHCAPIGERVAVVDGHSLTLPARTVIDLARTLPFEQPSWWVTRPSGGSVSAETTWTPNSPALRDVTVSMRHGGSSAS